MSRTWVVAIACAACYTQSVVPGTAFVGVDVLSRSDWSAGLALVGHLRAYDGDP